MPVDKEEKIRLKKLQIVEALKRLLEKNVYSNVTVQDIADESGFSKGGVLHYFSTKEDIYLELQKEIFTEFERSHRQIIEKELGSDELVPLSTLLDVESFILDKRNIKIMINLIQYAFEEEKIMNTIREFLEKHRMFYTSIIERTRLEHPTRRRIDIDPVSLSRIAQTVVLTIGILELMDPTEYDYIEIVKFVTAILKG